MKEKKRMSLSNPYHAHIVGCLANMVDEDGLTPQEEFEVLDDIIQNTFHTLSQLKKGDSNETR
ncbi:hypothetical protein [Bacillus sp. FJAT-45037]|uniref:hypothetical protein n=1 Tax=Bacillus sp. FJAT-45037 TaxID=2011007 RepID=UPI000C2449D9|nr:hypothetical protein [Bacillus sp. FJAT-45037]